MSSQACISRPSRNRQTLLCRMPHRPPLQMAKARGLRVATTASAANADLVRGLGADEVCDYKSQAFEGKLAVN